MKKHPHLRTSIALLIAVFVGFPADVMALVPAQTTEPQPQGMTVADFQNQNESSQNLVDTRNELLGFQNQTFEAASEPPPVFTYDGQGNLVQADWFYASGGIRLREFFDAEGVRTREIRFTTDSRVQEVRYYRSVTGTLFSVEEYGPQGAVARRRIYDDQERLSREQVYREDQSLDFITLYNPETGHAVRTDYFNPDGSWRETVIHSDEPVDDPDDNPDDDPDPTEPPPVSVTDPDTGVVIQTDWFYPGGRVRVREMYDAQGRLVRRLRFRNDLTLESVEYHDAAAGRLVSVEHYYSSGNVRSRDLYGSGGLIVRTQNYREDESLESISYYDAAGLLVGTHRYEAGQYAGEDTYRHATVDGQTRTVRESFDASGRKLSTVYLAGTVPYHAVFFEAASGLVRLEEWYAPDADGYRLSRRLLYNVGVPTRLEYVDAAGTVTRTHDAALLGDGQAIGDWFDTNQSTSVLGLVRSYPDEGSLNNQAFTYDQALAGITMLESGDTAGAQAIFEFFNNNWDGNGFWTVYNTDAVDGSKVEWQRINGPNAWIGLFFLRYHDQTGDTRALDLAVRVGIWLRMLPHKDGGLAMGSGGLWGKLYSVENNLSDYGFFRELALRAPVGTQRTLFAAEAQSIANWLRDHAYDSTTGLFKRGGYFDPAVMSQISWDATLAMDTNSWAVSALGVQGLKDLLGFDEAELDGFIARVEDRFAVQEDGTFDGGILTAKGFDFSDAGNAAAAERPGIKWVEGTHQMVLTYQLLERYYRSAGNAAKADYYQALARMLSVQAADNAFLSASGDLSYSYSDRPGSLVFHDIEGWSTLGGSSIAGTAWVYLTLYGINPFQVS